MATSNNPPQPQGSKLGPVEWTAIIGTCLTMVITLTTVAYTYGSSSNRLDTIEAATKDVPVTIQAIKGNIENLQELKEDVKALSKLESRVKALEDKAK